MQSFAFRNKSLHPEKCSDEGEPRTLEAALKTTPASPQPLALYLYRLIVVLQPSSQRHELFLRNLALQA